MVVLFAALFVNLNYLQVVQADELASNNANARKLIAEYESERGKILIGEGSQTRPIAESVETGGALNYLRVYDEGPRYGHITGFSSPIFGRSELEQSFDDFLTGSAPEAFTRNLADLLAGRERAGDAIHLTVRPEVQEAAESALGQQAGAVVALDPSTGDILALWSSPTYDPNTLASHEPKEVRASWNTLQDDPAKPLLNHALRESYPPGSTFKLVTAAAALEAGINPDRSFNDPSALELPQTTATIGNFGGGTCNGGQPITFERALAVSCNTTFAQLGLDLGTEALVSQAERFGFNNEWESQMPRLATSRIPGTLDPPSLAQSAIGQRDVRATPLQMAMVTAAIGFDGTLMTPRIVDRVEDASGRVIVQFRPQPLVLSRQPNAQVLSRGSADRLQAMMEQVVSSGSGQRAAISGVRVAGKTGTAQTGEGQPPAVWFVGFAPADNPTVAVAVVVPDGGNVGSEATGGQVAGPIAGAVMAAAVQRQ